MGSGGLTSRHPSRFRLETRLGEGAFGTVYAAYDERRAGKVALKELRQPNPDVLYRFKLEFRSLADLHHPNLVRLYELLSDGERWFFTMELIDGVDFLRYVAAAGRQRSAAPADTPTLGVDDLGSVSPVAAPQFETSPVFDPDKLRPALKQLAEGVQALHVAGKLHRDIKPSNVLVSREGRVVVLDFGMVKELAPEGATQSMVLLGTPAYMAPEQAASGDVSEASDWYAVGVVLYEALTGSVPFTGRVMEVLVKKQAGEPPPPADVAAGVPGDLNRLCTDLLQRDPTARPSGEEILLRLGSAAPSIAPAPDAGRGGPFVGRCDHLEFLWNAFRDSERGKPVVVFLHGGSGMGKTTLVRRFLSELRRRERQTVLLAGRCFEQEAVPYKGLDSLMDALSDYLQALPRTEQEQALPRDVLALARLFPVLRQASSVAGATARMVDIPDALELRRRAFAALRELFARIAGRRPLVLFVDDLQWSDLDSAALIHEIVRPPDAPALLFIGSYRTEEAQSSAPLRALLELTAARGPGLDVRELIAGELPSEDARELVLALAGRDDSLASCAEAIARESRGIPFFVHQLVRNRDYALRLAAEDGRGEDRKPAVLEELIRSRVSTLPEPARHLMELLAIAGRPLEREVLVGIAGAEQYTGAVDALQRERLIRTRVTGASEEFEPYHGRIADAIAAPIREEALRSHHGSIGRALEEWGRADPETLFVHFHEAGDRERAGQYAVAAAEQAWNALAFDRAARLYREAIAMLPPGDNRLHERLGDALANAGRGEEAAQAYLSASAGASSSSGLELRRKAVEQLFRSGRIDQGLATLREVLEELGLDLPATPRRALLSLVARRLHLRVRGLGFRERSAASIPPEELFRVDTCWSVAIGLGIVDHIRGADYQARHLLVALKTGELYRVARALALEVAFNANTGGRGRARTEMLHRRTMELVERLDSPHALGLAMLTAGLAAYLEGDWRRAGELLEQSEKILLEQCTGVSQELVSARNFLLRIYVWLGELNVLTRVLPDLLKDAHERGDLYAATMLGVRNSYIPRLASDDSGAAKEDTRRAIERWPQAGFHTPHYVYACAATEIDLYRGDGREAWRRISELWEPLRRSLILRVQFALLEATHLHARAAVAASLDGEGEAFLRIAERDAARIERERMAWSDPLAGLIRAAVAAGRGDRRSAVDLLASAERQLETASMRLYVAAARYSRGELLRDSEEGTALATDAERWMRSQSIHNPRRFARMLVPGNWS